MVQFKRRWWMFGLNLTNHFIIIFNDTCPESPPLQWSNGISSLGSHPSLNSFDLMACGGGLSLDSSQNSPVPTLPLGADYTIHYHYSSGVTSSWNSPGSAPTNTVTQFPCDIDRHSSPMTGDSFTVDYGYLCHLQSNTSSLFLQSDHNDNPILHLGQISYPNAPAITLDIEQNHTRADMLTSADVECICNEHDTKQCGPWGPQTVQGCWQELGVNFYYGSCSQKNGDSSGQIGPSEVYVWELHPCQGWEDHQD